MTQPQNPFPDYAHGPYASLIPTRPTSVTVIAIIGIILGGLGVLCMPFTLIPYLVQMPGVKDPLINAVKNNPAVMSWTVGSTVAYWVIHVTLLAGSIGSLRLRSWARTTTIGYAWAEIVLAIAGMIFNFTWMFPTMRRLSSGNASTAAGLMAGIVGGIFGLVIGLALPICILYYYNRPHVIAAFEGERT